MKKILINLKDYLDLGENKKFSDACCDLPIVVFPSLPYLYLYKGYKDLGVQRICSYESGAHTGSVSIDHLKNFNINWAIINHREARHYNREELFDKITSSIENGLSTIVCFKNMDELSIIIDIIDDINVDGSLYIAYEPELDISVENLIEDIDFIKHKVGEKSIRIIYGGNISVGNIDKYNKELNIDGFLISKHALSVKDLKTMINLVK